MAHQRRCKTSAIANLPSLLQDAASLILGAFARDVGRVLGVPPMPPLGRVLSKRGTVAFEGDGRCGACVIECAAAWVMHSAEAAVARLWAK